MYPYLSIIKLVSFMLLILLISGCGGDYIPPKHESLTEGQYQRYVTNLNKAYRFNSQFQVAMQLANLKADRELVYTTLDKSLKVKPDDCLKLYNSLFLYQESGKKTKIVELDTPRFLETMELCFSLLGKDSYVSFKQKQQERIQQMLADRPALDSSKFDQPLIAQLQLVTDTHKDLREAIASGAHPEASVQAKDKENLKVIEEVIDKYGYPSKELVGYDVAGTVFDILHHQEDLGTRKKYRALLENKVGESRMNLYDLKTKELELN